MYSEGLGVSANTEKSKEHQELSLLDRNKSGEVQKRTLSTSKGSRKTSKKRKGRWSKIKSILSN
jgi:hypothetical protein